MTAAELVLLPACPELIAGSERRTAAGRAGRLRRKRGQCRGTPKVSALRQGAGVGNPGQSSINGGKEAVCGGHPKGDDMWQLCGEQGSNLWQWICDVARILCESGAAY